MAETQEKEYKFSAPQEYIITSTQDVNLFLAGIGSGKTHIIGILSGYYINRFPTVFGFIGANTYLQLSQSTLFRVRKVWGEVYGWFEDIDYVMDKKPPKHFNTDNHEFRTYKGIVSFKSGAVVFIGSLDNAKAHDGKEFGWAFLDETKDTKEEAVKDIILGRLRAGGIFLQDDGQLTDSPYGEFGELLEVFNPLYITTSPAKVPWINEWFKLYDYADEIIELIYDKEKFFIKEFEDKGGGKCVTISSTYHNIKNLPHGYIKKQIGHRSEESAKTLIYGNPFVRTGGEFYGMFDRMKQVKECNFIEGLPLHIAFDQNVKPYITCTVYQVDDREKGRYTINQVDEICLEHPRNKTSKLCAEFLKRWGDKCGAGLFYYGDCNGRNDSTNSDDDDYAIVHKTLRRYLHSRSDRVPSSNPSVINRRDFINDIFEGAFSNLDTDIGVILEFFIDPKCKKSILDFETVKEDKQGKKHKETAKDPISKAVYEKYGHTSDSFDYFICEFFKNIFALYSKK